MASSFWDDLSSSIGVLPDVSMSEPPLQPQTATGNGYGYTIDNGWLGAIGGLAHDAVNYAILRDQQKIAQQTGTVYAGTPLAPTPQLAAKQQNSRILLLGGVAVALALILRGK